MVRGLFDGRHGHIQRLPGLAAVMASGNCEGSTRGGGRRHLMADSARGMDRGYGVQKPRRIEVTA
jgi:hypothetical protein